MLTVPAHVAERLEDENEKLQAASAAMREALNLALSMQHETWVGETFKKALSSDAGRDIIDRLKTAEAEGDAYEKQLREMQAQRDGARQWVDRMRTETQVLTCVYCGHAYPPGSPTHGAEVLTAHVKTCEKHPMRTVEASALAMRHALEPFRSVNWRFYMSYSVEYAEAAFRSERIHAVDDALGSDAGRALLDRLKTAEAAVEEWQDKYRRDVARNPGHEVEAERDAFREERNRLRAWVTAMSDFVCGGANESPFLIIADWKAELVALRAKCEAMASEIERLKSIALCDCDADHDTPHDPECAIYGRAALIPVSTAKDGER